MISTVLFVVFCLALIYRPRATMTFLIYLAILALTALTTLVA